MDKLLNKAKKEFSDRVGDIGGGAASHAGLGKSSAIQEALTQGWDAPPTARQIYQYRRQRGVNLGSLFTLETWLTPSLFHGVKGANSEQDLCKSLKGDEARKRLERHWASFVDDGDWKWMARNGINTIRLPISYYHWLSGHPDRSTRALLEGTEYEGHADVYSAAHQAILALVDKARQHGIGVLIDLHGAPGGQNTEGHCGLSTNKAAFFEKSKHRSNTIAILRSLIDAFVPYENVVGIELLNEPHNHGKLPGFYHDAIDELAAGRPDNARLPIYIGDCWCTDQYVNLLGQRIAKDDARILVVIDHHLYRCFTPQDHGKSAHQHADEVHPRGNGPSIGMLRSASKGARGSIIIGEWSAALNPGSLQGPGDARSQHQKWATAQLEAYNEVCAGFFFWTLKKEGPPDAGWCLYSAIEQGVLPAGLGQPRRRGSPQELEDTGKSRLVDRYNGHCGYWQQNANGARMMHEKYRDGYTQGWRDAMAFAGFQNGHPSVSEIGFAGQWIALRAQAYAVQRHGGNRDNEWEFVHGFEASLADFGGALRGR